jgi:hypothetical protein
MNSYIKGLYDMAQTTNEEGLSVLDEQKLRRALDGNKKLFGKNSDIFAEEPKSQTCSMYNPCPICSKCLNKASHLYVRCQTCGIPICVHTYKDKKFMIRRENFAIIPSPEVKGAIRQMAKEAESK